MTRTLLLVRHAKSSWENLLLTDKERPLNARGERVSLQMGKYLRENGLLPDLVHSSPALRAWQTAVRLTAAFPHPVDIHIDDTLYEAEPVHWWQVLQNLPDDAQCVLLTGHNPALHLLVSEMADFLVPKFPTCCVAVVEVNCAHWSDINRADTRVKELLFPKKLGF